MKKDYIIGQNAEEVLVLLKNKTIHIILQMLPFAVMVIFSIVFLFSRQQFTVHTLLSYTPQSFVWATLFIMLMYFLKGFSVVLPVSVLHVLTGIIFPIIPALILNVIGTAMCMAIGYFVGYFSVSNYAEKMIKKHPKVDEIVRRQRDNEWFSTYFLRIVPISGDLVSVYLGSLRISVKKYFIASILGSLPGIVATTLLGVSIEDPLSPMCIVAFSMMAVYRIG